MKIEPISESITLKYRTVLVVACIGFAGTFWLTNMLWDHAQRTDQIRFNTLSHFMQERLDDRVEKYEQCVSILREYFLYHEYPTQIGWRQMVDRLKLSVNYKAMVEVGYAPKLKNVHLSQPASNLIEAINGGFSLRKQLQPGEVYIPVLYRAVLPPLGYTNIGDNLGDTLGERMFNSEIRNAISITRRVPLGLAEMPPSDTNRVGFYMMHTVYDDKLPVEVPQQPQESYKDFMDRLIKQRTDHYRGTVFAGISIDVLLADIIEDAVLEIAFEIFDGPKPWTSRRINQVIAVPSDSDRLRRLDITNRISLWPMYLNKWAIEFFPTAEFDKNSTQKTAWIAMVAGACATFFATALMFIQTRRRLSAEKHANEMNEARNVIESLSRERDQSSRDLHDGVLQSLYALGLGLQKTRKAIARDTVNAQDSVIHNIATLDMAMGELRRHLNKGSQQSMQEMKLDDALHSLVETMNRSGNIPVHYQCERALSSNPATDISIQLLHIAREAVINAQRHSGAEKIIVRIWEHKDALSMSIIDNGCGFEPETLLAHGNGLKNMAYRAEELGASYQLVTAVGKGVNITVHVSMGLLSNINGKSNL